MEKKFEMNDELKEIINDINNSSKAVTIVSGNAKGGVGKTSNAYLIAYTLSKWGIKTLVADLDPQANATKTLMLTKSLNEDKVNTIDKTLMSGVQNGDLKDLPINIIPNLDLIPSYIDFQDFTKYLYTNSKNEYDETHLLQPLFEPFKSEYKVIILDVPPFSIEITNNAVMMSDYALIILQTQADSLTGAEEYVETLTNLKQKYDLPIEVLGILPVLQDRNNRVDHIVLDAASKEFGSSNIFKTQVDQMARIKRFPINGITNNDRFDEKVLNKYDFVTEEFLKRLELFKEEY